MPESKSRRDTELAKYEAMSTEELQTLLREDASKPEGDETNMEVLFYVMEVLAKRRQARQEGKTPEEALESFVKNYMPEAEDASSSEGESTGRKHKPVVRRWMRGLVAAAATIVLVFGMSLTANAFGFDIWEIIVQWTQETLHFGYVEQSEGRDDPGKDDQIHYSELQAVLEEYHISVDLVPSWLPDGYVESDVRVIETPKQRQFIAQYQCGDSVIKIWIADYLDADPAQIEQSGSNVEVYESGDVKYYLFNDIDELREAWITDSFVCCLRVPFSIEELKTMIYTIEKG